MFKNVILPTILCILIGTGFAALNGCTAQQVQDEKTSLIAILQRADDAVGVLADNPAALQETEMALSTAAAILPQTGPVHQAIVDAQAALNALIAKKATVNDVHVALGRVIDLLEGNGSIPRGMIRSRAFPKK